MIDLYNKGKEKFGWWKDWRGECAAIVAAGPSARIAGVEKLKNRIHCVVINESHRLCPWADILYSCDSEWWRLRYSELKKFGGIKLAHEIPRHMPTPVSDIYEIKIAEVKPPFGVERFQHEFLFDEPGVIGSGMNSGFQTINITAQFGVTGLALIGFDMKLDDGIHWHGNHPPPLRNPDVERFSEWRKILDEKSHKLIEHDIDVVNCSNGSALTSFKKLTIDQMLERWGL